MLIDLGEALQENLMPASFGEAWMLLGFGEAQTEEPLMAVDFGEDWTPADSEEDWMLVDLGEA